MKKLVIKNIKVDISAGGFACGPMGGYVVAEARIRDMETGTTFCYTSTEYEGCPRFYRSEKSIFKILIEEDYNTEGNWEKTDKACVADFLCYDDFYAYLADHVKPEEEEDALIWRYLVYMMRADDAETKRMTELSKGKALGSFEIPATDVEEEYLEAKDEEDEEDEDEEDSGDEEDEENGVEDADEEAADEDEEEDEEDEEEWGEERPKINEAYEQKLLEDFRAEFIGQKLGNGCCLYLEEGKYEAGVHEAEYQFQSCYNEYRCCGSYTLDENGVITDIGPMECEVLIGDDATHSSFAPISADIGFDHLRDELTEMIEEVDEDEEEYDDDDEE